MTTQVPVGIFFWIGSFIHIVILPREGCGFFTVFAEQLSCNPLQTVAMSASLEEQFPAADEIFDSSESQAERSSELLANSSSFLEEEIKHSSTPTPLDEGRNVEKEDTGDGYTLEEAVDSLGVGGYQLMVFLYCGLAWLAGGMNIMSVPIISASVKCQWYLSGIEESLLSFLTLIGCSVGLVFWTYLSHTFGYRMVFISANAIMMLFRALGALKLTPDDAHLPGYTWLLFCQFAIGFGASASFLALVFLQHFLPQRSQLQWSLYLTVWWGVGATMAAALAAIVMGHGHFTWHMYSGLLGMPSVVLTGLTFLLPESPLHYLTKGKCKDTEKSLKWMARLNRKELPKGQLHEEARNTQESCNDLCCSKNQLHCSILNHIWSSSLFTEQMWKRSVPVGVLWLAASWIYFCSVFLTVNMLKLQAGCKRYRFDLAANPGMYNASLSNPVHFEVYHVHREVCGAGMLKPSNYIHLVWIYGAELPDVFILTLLARVVGPKLSMSVTTATTMMGVSLLFLCTSEKRLTVFLVFIRVFSSVFVKAMYAYTPQVYPKRVRDIGIRYSMSMFLLGALLAPLFCQVLLEASIAATLTIYAGVCLATVFGVLLLPIGGSGKKRLLKA